jgi:putative ABC transport system substrate-binding protein
MARPGGNITGFTSFELTIGGKWLEALKEIVPGVTRSVVILNPDNPAAGGFLGVIEAAATSLGIQITPVVLRDASDPERATRRIKADPSLRGPGPVARDRRCAESCQERRRRH